MRTPVALVAECKLTQLSEGEIMVSIREVLVMDDLSRVELTTDRGFGSRSFPRGPHGTDPADLDRGVLMALLPDDAEQSGEQREWGRLAAIASKRGIRLSADELRGLSSRIEYDHLGG